MSHLIQNLASPINLCDFIQQRKLTNCDMSNTSGDFPDTFYPEYKMDGAIHSPYDQTNENHQIGSYVLDRVIGRGNFSVVKLGVHIPTKMQVAIKVLHKTKMSGETLEKTYREVHIMKQLSHANIVKLYQVIELPSWMFIIMEYVSHGELFDYLSKVGKLTENDARIKFSQILGAVEYCHKMKIVHRDLKAENLLMDGNLNIKLADFGFGSFYNDSYLLSTWCGSPPYAAPELFIGEPYIGPKADIWSLGVVLYAMVCGKLPFDEPCNIVKLREQVLSGWVRFPYFLSYECEHLIRLILNRDPIKRPSIKYIKDHKWMQPSFDESLALHGASPFGDMELWQAPTRDRSSRRCNTVGDDSGFDEPLDFIKSFSERNSLSLNNNCSDFDVSDRVLRIMEQRGFNRSAIIDELKRNTYGHSTATYLLLCEKLRLNQSTSSSGHFTPPSSRMLQSESMAKKLPGETVFINNTLTSPTCQLSLLQNVESYLRRLQIDDTDREMLSERSSPYHNITNKNVIKFFPTLMPQNNADTLLKSELSLETKRQVENFDKNIGNYHTDLVVLNILIPNVENRENNSIGNDRGHKVPINQPEGSLSHFDAVHKLDSVQNHLCSLTHSTEMKTSRPFKGITAPVCTMLAPKSSPTNYIPIPDKGADGRWHATNGHHPIYRQSPNVMCQISSLYNMPNGQELYGHCSALKFKGFSVDTTTIRPRVERDEERMSTTANDGHAHKNDSTAALFNEQLGCSRVNRQTNRPSPCCLVCHGDDRKSLSNCSHCLCNIGIQPIADDRQMTAGPCLSSGNRAMLLHSGSFSQNIPPYNIPQVSQISPLNINFINLS